MPLNKQPMTHEALLLFLETFDCSIGQKKKSGTKVTSPDGKKWTFVPKAREGQKYYCL